MKVLFYLTSRYPTEKAYGVTTGETARALRQLGHDVAISGSLKSKSHVSEDIYGNQLRDFGQISIVRVTALIEKLYKILPPLFVINSILKTIASLKRIRMEQYDVIWLRDSLSALVFANVLPKSWFVLEIHHRPRPIQKALLRILSRFSNVLFVAIQDSLVKELKAFLPADRLEFCPMGVSEAFFIQGEEHIDFISNHSSQDPIKVCFLGRLSSSGEDNGIHRLIHEWRNISPEIAELTILGLSADEIKKLKPMCRYSNIHLSQSVEHNRVPRILSKFDCGILPYPESSYNRSRFPIKSLEYAAVGLAILATRTQGHLEILDSEASIFYDLHQHSSLRNKLELLKSETNLLRNKAIAARNWAQSYTYVGRVQRVLDLIERQPHC